MDFNDIFKNEKEPPTANYDEGYILKVRGVDNPYLERTIMVKKRKELANILNNLDESKWAVTKVEIAPYVFYYNEFLRELQNDNNFGGFSLD